MHMLAHQGRSLGTQCPVAQSGTLGTAGYDTDMSGHSLSQTVMVNLVSGLKILILIQGSRELNNFNLIVFFHQECQYAAIVIFLFQEF
jgi:hypothetical protein